MAFSTSYTFGFATAVCVICSLSVASVSIGLREKQDVNKRRDLQGNILKALGLPEGDARPTGEEIDTLWAERVEFRVVDPKGAIVDAAAGDRDGDGDLDVGDTDLAAEAAADGASPALLPLYVRKDGAAEVAYAVPMHGKGLWGPLSGYLALDPKASSVVGVSFFADKETPGLGAEITKAKFKDPWTGKKVVDASGAVQPIRVVKGAAATLCPDDLEHCVDGVSGATITCRGVDAMVAQSLGWYDPYLKQLRGR